MEKMLYYPSEGRIEEIEISDIEYSAQTLKKKRDEKRSFSKLELFAIDTIGFIDAMLHNNHGKYMQKKNMGLLEEKFKAYLERAEKEDETEEDISSSLIDEEEKYVEAIVDDNGIYKPIDEIDEYLSSIDYFDSSSMLYSFIKDEKLRLDPKKKVERLAILKLLNLKQEFKSLFQE